MTKEEVAKVVESFYEELAYVTDDGKIYLPLGDKHYLMTVEETKPLENASPVYLGQGLGDNVNLELN